MNKKEVFTNLLKNIESYDPNDTLKRFSQNKDKIIESCDKHFPSNKKLLKELFEENPIIETKSGYINRVWDLSKEIGKKNELLQSGKVAAIDGTTKFSIDDFVFHHYFSIVVGYVTYKKNDFKVDAEHWDTSLSMNDINQLDYDDVARIVAMKRMSENNKMPKNDLMIYKERELSLNIDATHILLDGPIFFESLLSYSEGQNLYNLINNNNKKYIGIIKDISSNGELTLAAESLNAGEARIVTDSYYKSQKNEYLKNYYIGVFKIKNKAYGFEVNKSDFKEMLSIIFNDCINNSIYEIPWLLSAIDKGIKQYNEMSGIQTYLITEIQKKHPDFFSLIKKERDLR